MAFQYFHRAGSRAHRIAAIGVALLATLVLLPGDDAGAGIQGTGFSKGRITRFGSIFVNGVEFVTTGATVYRDGLPATEADLQLGERVSLRGSVDATEVNGVATRVDYDDDVQGSVTAVDPLGGSFVIGGQVIQVDAATVYGPALQPGSIESLSVGQRLRVSGFEDSHDVLVASRVDVLPAGVVDQLLGQIEDLDQTTLTFRIRGVSVDYSAAGQLPPSLFDGLSVDVSRVPTTAAGAWRATRIEERSGAFDEVGDVGGVEGYIGRFTSPLDFEVAGQAVLASSATEIRPRGATYGLDTLVEVDGVLDDTGRLLARQIRVKTELDHRITATVDDVDAAAGTLTVLGVPLQTTAFTRFVDRSSLRLRNFALDDLRRGDTVEVRYPENGSVAVLEREKPSRRIELQGIGRRDAITGLSIGGVAVTTTPDTGYVDTLDQPLSRAAFLAAANGRIVAARGSEAGNGVVAAQLALVD